MAQKIVLIDDLDGPEASTTLTYAVDRQEYEIDLSKENAEKFRTTLEPYIEKSRSAERRPAPQTAAGRRRDGAAGEQVDAMTCR